MTENIEIQMKNNGMGDVIQNGHFHDSQIDEEMLNHEQMKDLQRPADVKEDMRQMVQRQRVTMILNSQAFCDELEAIIADQQRHGPHPHSLIALQQISEMLLPSQRAASSSKYSNAMNMSNRGHVVIPINDIRGCDTALYSKGERLTRCKLASLFRLIDMFGWTNGIHNNITLRICSETQHFLTNPFGLLYHEITASSLIRLDLDGNILDEGSTTFGVNKGIFTIHASIQEARPDIKCIIYLQNDDIISVSNMKCGLLALSQESMICSNCSYHEFYGMLMNDEEKAILIRNLGSLNKILFLINSGVLCCGETIEEAWYYCVNLVVACRRQIKSLSAVGGDVDKLHRPSKASQQQVRERIERGTIGKCITGIDNGEHKWKLGEMDFEALMRCLDNAGYRTGYIYRKPITRRLNKNGTASDVKLPPTCTGVANGHGNSIRHDGEWLNSPNVYTKKELKEIGSSHNGEISTYTTWVQNNDGIDKSSTPLKLESKHNFVKLHNKEELNSKRQLMQQASIQNKIDSGHTSKILNETNMSNNMSLISYPPDINSPLEPEAFIVTPASRAIIRKEAQHNLQVMQEMKGQNPFTKIKFDPLTDYKEHNLVKNDKEMMQSPGLLNG